MVVPFLLHGPDPAAGPWGWAPLALALLVGGGIAVAADRLLRGPLGASAVGRFATVAALVALGVGVLLAVDALVKRGPF